MQAMQGFGQNSLEIYGIEKWWEMTQGLGLEARKVDKRLTWESRYFLKFGYVTKV
jgi:hypothetical protein